MPRAPDSPSRSVGESGVVGTFSAMFPDERRFGDGDRDTLRQLAAEAGLAFELLASRTALERERQDSSRDAQLAGMLLRVSEGLAGLTDTRAVTRAMGEALLGSTGASMALVGRFDGQRFAIAAAAGLSPERLALLGRLEPVTDRFGVTRELAAGRMVELEEPIADDMFPAPLVGSMVHMLATSIFLGDRVWGFLGVGVRAADAFLADRGEALLTGLATIAATALARAEAVERLEAQTDALESAVTERTAQLQEVVGELQARRARPRPPSWPTSATSCGHRSPAILGFSELLLAGSEGPLTAGQRDDLETVVRSSRHLMELIDDLIDVSRIETGRNRAGAGGRGAGPAGEDDGRGGPRARRSEGRHPVGRAEHAGRGRGRSGSRPRDRPEPAEQRREVHPSDRCRPHHGQR